MDGLVGTLTFHAEYKTTSQTRLLLLDSRLNIHVDRATSNAALLGTAFQQHPDENHEIARLGEFSASYQLPLNHGTLELLENHRGGRKLTLRAEAVMIGLNLD